MDSTAHLSLPNLLHRIFWLEIFIGLRKSIAAKALPGDVTFKEQRNHLLKD